MMRYLKQSKKKRKYDTECTVHTGVYDYIILVFVVADVAQSSSSTSEPSENHMFSQICDVSAMCMDIIWMMVTKILFTSE